jgi:hypothetical protein
MKPAVQVKCPNCQNLLRIPPGMVDISVKCKHCGYILQIKKKSNANVPTAAASPFAGMNGASAQGRGLAMPSELPEFTPPTPPGALAQRPAPTAPMPLVETLASLDECPTTNALRPSVEGQPAAAPSDYNPAFQRAGRRHTGRGGYKGPKKNADVVKWAAVGGVVLLGASVLGFVLLKGKPTESTTSEKNVANVPGGPAKPGQQPGATIPAPPAPEPELGVMPRRLLGIGVSNYLFANPIQYGKGVGRDRHDFSRALERLADGWRIPKAQRYFVVDGASEDGKIDHKHPPLKMVIEGTIDTFLKTSRAQDRIVIVFAGHALEKDGEVYLVPLEGEFEWNGNELALDVSSMISLKSVYEKLAKCPAQEKLVIFDVCRFFAGKGVEKPSFGAMTEGLDKALHDCPAGVSVWTACSVGQYSYEEEEAEVTIIGLGKPRIEGSYFLSMLFPAFDRGILGRREQGGNIQNPSDPLPLGPVSAFINEKTTAVVKELIKKEQAPKLTLKRRTEWLAYNPTETVPARFEITSPPPTAKREEVAGMFKELDLPSIKSIRKNDDTLPLADSFPFTEAQLKGYFNTGPTFDEIAKAPEKFAKEFPLRAATVEALVEMRKLKNEGGDLPEEFRAPITDATKKDITNRYQRTVTERQGILDELKDKLESVAKKRDMEKSKRWLANFDYAYAQVRARLAYIYEYNGALGNVKLEKLPEIDPKLHKGWRIAAVKKMESGKEFRDLADDAKASFAEIATNYANTPWAVMAKSQKNMTFGQKWEPLAISESK